MIGWALSMPLAFAQTTVTTTAGGTTGRVPEFSGNSHNIENSVITQSTGSVGIGSTVTPAKLTVYNGGISTEPQYGTVPIPTVNVVPVYSARFADTGNTASLLIGGIPYNYAWLQVAQDDESGLAVRGWKNMILQPSGGAVGIGTTASDATLEVDGNVKFTAGSGASITLQDGTTQTTAYTGSCGGDWAESVDVAGDRHSYAPGDILVVDPDHPERFLKSAEPYSTAVPGVYSTKPGTVGRRQIGPKSPDEIPMAMVGIVPVNVSVENGPIKPGDLLVTASRMGYAMKGTDRSRILGAVIGKALDRLDSGTGVIEVGVTLQ